MDTAAGRDSGCGVGLLGNGVQHVEASCSPSCEPYRDEAGGCSDHDQDDDAAHRDRRAGCDAMIESPCHRFGGRPDHLDDG
jgi:hypothetical protein